MSDGDSIDISNIMQKTKVRLIDIDAPEKNQPHGINSKQFLSTLILGKEVVIESKGQDRYGRTLAKVYSNNLDVNAEMVRSGGNHPFFN